MKKIVYEVLAVISVMALIKYGIMTIMGYSEPDVLKQQKVLDEKVEVMAEEMTASIQSNQVYVTVYGEKYHDEFCRYLHRSKRAMLLEQAREIGYTPCAVCLP